MKEIVVTENLTKIYNKKVLAVDHVNLRIYKGEIFGFLGPNGAGKTTTIKMLVTLLQPTEGTAFVNGFNILTEPHEVRKNIGIVFQEPALDLQLTGKENLDFHARIYGLKRDERKKRINEVLELVNLKDKADILVKNYSGGMKRRLEIARGLMHYPNVLFLDEPTLGLDPQSRRAIWDYIKEINKRENVTVFLTTHYMDEAEYLCDRVAIIDHGKILVLNSPAALKNSLGNDLITLSCNSTEKLYNALKSEHWVKNLKIHGEELFLGVKSGEKRLVQIINLASELNVKVNFVNLRKPTLEDVFLHYTGRKIRDEKRDFRREITIRRMRR